MKIIVKTLSGNVFNLDVEPTDTILQIKEKIHEQKQFEVALQKLLRKGVLLDDKATVAELNIQENEFLVVMVNKKKPDQPAQVPVQPVQQPVQPIQPVQPVQPVQPPVQPQQTQPVSQPGNTSSQLVSGPEYENTLQELMSMGFTKEECQQAMKAAFNNPERAADYLINGIPPNILAQLTQQRPPATTTTSQNPPPTGQGAQQPQVGGAGQFDQLRALLQNNPQQLQQVLPQLMAQLQQTNPQLYAQLQQNPQLLIQLLAQLGGGRQGPPPGQIQVTPQEMQDIETIQSMGFGKQDSLEAYLACDKNIESAINYLFEKQANGDLYSQHLERERNNPENQQPPGGQPPHEDDDDDDVYQ